MIAVAMKAKERQDEDSPERRKQTCTTLSIATSRERSPLFSLSSEIRTHLYEDVLHIPFPEIRIIHQDEISKRPSVLAVLETCRRILNEAETIF